MCGVTGKYVYKICMCEARKQEKTKGENVYSHRIVLQVAE
jgi:hypothetical protein